jgi:hypothetical protein
LNYWKAVQVAKNAKVLIAAIDNPNCQSQVIEVLKTLPNLEVLTRA